MRHFLERDFQPQTLINACYGALWNLESLGAHDATRKLIGHSKDHAPAPLVRERDAVSYQLFKVVMILGRFELKVLVLRTYRKQAINLLNGSCHDPRLVSFSFPTFG